jgi:hypothetical protein
MSNTLILKATVAVGLVDYVYGAFASKVDGLWGRLASAELATGSAVSSTANDLEIGRVRIGGKSTAPSVETIAKTNLARASGLTAGRLGAFVTGRWAVLKRNSKGERYVEVEEARKGFSFGQA